MNDHEQVEVKSRAALRSWLKAHHGQQASIWLVHYKKGSHHYLAYDEIVEEAICWGWIDSLPRALDKARTMHRLSPRKAGSNWSARNKRIAEQAITAGCMAAPGMKAIERAKQNGRWGALDAIESGEMPGDLIAMLRSRKGAKGNFAAFPPSVRRGILEWIEGAKTEATRKSRLRDTADKAARNQRVHQFERTNRKDA